MSFQQAMRDFSGEVEAEAERLVRLGVPPWDAIIQARQRVSKRRREAAKSDPAIGKSADGSLPIGSAKEGI